MNAITIPDLEPPPLYQCILAVDIKDSTKRLNPEKREVRRAMYEMLEESLRASGITRKDHEEFIDRGDGILVLINPRIPKTLLLAQVVPHLRALLIKYASEHHELLQMRAIVHAGEVHQDNKGHFGEALDVSFRLLDAPEVKGLFRQTADPLLLVVSDEIYKSIVRHDYSGIESRRFIPVTNVTVGDQPHMGWAIVPREPISKFDVDILIDARSRFPQRVKRLRRIDPPPGEAQTG